MDKKLFSLAMVAILTATPISLDASTQTWTGLGGDNLWTTSGNWSTAVPVSTDTALFNSAGNSNTSISLSAASQLINTIQFDTANAAAYSLGVLASGDTFNFDASGAITVTNSVTTLQTINAAVQTNGALSVSNSGTAAGGLKLAGNVTIGGAGTLTVTNGVANTTTTLGGNITEVAGQPAALSLQATVGGGGNNNNYVINGTNSYTGGTTINVNTGSAGSIQMATDSPFGTGTVAMSLVTGTASPQFQALGGTRTIGNTFNLGSGLTFVGTNNLVFTGPMAVINTTPGSAAGRTLNESVANITATFGASPGSSTITLGNPSSNGGDNLGKTLTLNAATNGTIVVNDVLSDPAPGGGTASGILTVTGGGTVQLKALNTYSGGTSLTGAGTILPITVSSNALPGPSFTAGPFGTGQIIVNNGSNQHFRPTGLQTISNAILMTTGFAMDTVAGDTTSSITFAGPITEGASGKFIANGFSTGTSATGPMIIGSPSPAAPSTVTIANASGATLNISGVWGPIVVNDVVQDFNGTTAGAVALNVQSGNISTIRLNAQNTYSGGTTIGTSAAYVPGAILIGANSTGNPGAITSGPFGKGTITANNPNASGSPPNLVPIGADRTVANAITMTSGFFVSNQGADTFNLALTGPLSLTTAGRTITNNLAGTLTLGSSSTPSTITLGTTAGQQLQFQTQNSTATTVVNDSIQNASGGGAGVLVVASGTVQLNAASTYSNGTTISGGKLLVNNTTGSGTGSGAVTVNGGIFGGTGAAAGAVTVNNTGTISPGASIAALSIGALTLNTGSTFVYEMNSGAALAAAADLLNVGGGLTIAATGATLSISDAGNTVLAPGTKFTLISYSGAWNNNTFSGFADDSTVTLGVNQFVLNYNDISAGSSNFGGGSFTNAVTLTAVPEANAFWLGGAICLVVGLTVSARKMLGKRAVA